MTVIGSALSCFTLPLLIFYALPNIQYVFFNRIHFRFS